jgi:single-strand DNA-binding protein
MSKPEIYNDREGKPQISLQMVAHNISFSPFGRPAGSKPEGGQETSFAPSGFSAPEKGNETEKTDTFLDEEIPF